MSVLATFSAACLLYTCMLLQSHTAVTRIVVACQRRPATTHVRSQQLEDTDYREALLLTAEINNINRLVVKIVYLQWF